MNDCPWCHGTDTQFCENPDCRPAPAQYTEHEGNACQGVMVSAFLWVVSIASCMVGSLLTKLLEKKP